MKHVFTAVMATVLLAMLVSGCAGQTAPYRETQFAMDTIVEITAYGPQAEEAVKAAFSEMHRLDRMLNSHRPDSEVAAINSNAGGLPVQVSDETLKVITKAVRFAEATGGAFDPTIGPVVNLWGIGQKTDFIPGEDQLKAVLTLVDYRRLKIDSASHSVRLTDKGMAIDLGGIAKGYIIDQMAAILKNKGITAALINGGGDIRAIGSKPDGSPWRIGIQHPRLTDGLSAKITLHKWNRVATSGDYQRFFVKNGVRYHHIFDPKTGKPVQTIPSATLIMTPDAEDIPSNILMVLGKDRAVEFLRRFPGVEAVLVDYDGSVTSSPGLQGSIETSR